MATISLRHRLRVYAPRSVDPTESTILVPRAGAAHGDAFQVTTVEGGAVGWRAYAATIKGRRGKMSLRDRTTDKGQLVVRVLDRRVASDVTGGNDTRWVTAFLGNTIGESQLAGCKMYIEESVDAGATWTAYYTGRIQKLSITSPLWWEFEVRDMAEDLEADVFVGKPHSSITYAGRQALAPVGLLSAYGSFPVTPKFSGEIITSLGSTYGAPQFGIRSYPQTAKRQLPGFMATQALRDAAVTELFSQSGVKFIGVQVLKFVGDKVRVALTRLDTGVSGEFQLDACELIWNDPVGGRTLLMENAILRPLVSTDLAYMATPTVGTVCSWSIISTGGPTATTPLIINDVHPALLMRDMLNGKFGYLDATGAVKRSVVLNNSVFSALIADTSFGTFKGPIPAKDKLNDFIEAKLCKPYGIAYAFDQLGQFTPQDVRVPSSLPSVPTITDADIYANPMPTWSQDRSQAITRVDIAYKYDDYTAPAFVLGAGNQYAQIPPSFLQTLDARLTDADYGARFIDLGEHIVTLDAFGYRGTKQSFADPTLGTVWDDRVQAKLLAVAKDLKFAFRNGEITIPLTARRGMNADCQPGDVRYIAVSTTPDPVLNKRGGTRLCRCTERTETDLLLTMVFTDLGLAVQMVAPVLTIAAGADAKHETSIGVTLNASLETVVVEINATPTTTAVLPGATDPNWVAVKGYSTFQPGGSIELVTSQTVIAYSLAGKRVWVRARSMGGSADAKKLPSAYAYPTPAYNDTTGLLAPTAAGTPVTQITSTTAMLNWVNADATLEVEVYLAVGGVPSVWTTDYRIDTVRPGTTMYFLSPLVASTAYSAAVMSRAPDGSRSAPLIFSFTTTVSVPSAPRPAGIAVVLV